MDLREHLIERGMDPNLYRVQYGEDEVTFFLYNLSGQIIGYQTYRPWSFDKKNNDPKLGRYYTYSPKQTIAVFGLEALDYSKKDLFLVEGIFKAATLQRLGYNSIAVLSNNPKQMKSWFRLLRTQFNLIAIGDNDPAGKKLITCVGNGFQSPVDLDEMSDNGILEMLKGDYYECN